MKTYTTLSLVVLVIVGLVWAAWMGKLDGSVVKAAAAVQEVEQEVAPAAQAAAAVEEVFEVSDAALTEARASVLAQQEICKSKQADIAQFERSIEARKEEIPSTEEQIEKATSEFKMLQEQRDSLVANLAKAKSAAPATDPAEGADAKAEPQQSLEFLQAELTKLNEQFTARQNSLKELLEKCRLAKEDLALQCFNLKWAIADAHIQEASLKVRKARCNEVEQMFLAYGRSGIVSSVVAEK